MNNQNITTNLIQFIDKEYRISHRILAEKTNVSQISIRKLIDKHKLNLEKFGGLSFEMTTLETAGGKQNSKTFYLNELQVTLLLTFMKNNEIVIDFKVSLIDEFYKMRHIISLEKSEPKKPSLKQETENIILASEQYEALEKVFKKFGNLSQKELVEKTSNSVFQKTGIDFLKMFGEFPKEVKHSFKNTFSLTSLLEKYNIQIQTSKFNLKLEEIGIIEKRSKNWFILNLSFGKNEVYQNDTNPKYFEESFEDLLKLVFP